MSTTQWKDGLAVIAKLSNVSPIKIVAWDSTRQLFSIFTLSPSQVTWNRYRRTFKPWDCWGARPAATNLVNGGGFPGCSQCPRQVAAVYAGIVWRCCSSSWTANGCCTNWRQPGNYQRQLALYVSKWGNVSGMILKDIVSFRSSRDHKWQCWYNYCKWGLFSASRAASGGQQRWNWTESD